MLLHLMILYRMLSNGKCERFDVEVTRSVHCSPKGAFGNISRLRRAKSFFPSVSSEKASEPQSLVDTSVSPIWQQFLEATSLQCDYESAVYVQMGHRSLNGDVILHLVSSRCNDYASIARTLFYS
jgi:hypothetical protein